MEKTFKFKQHDIREHLDTATARKVGGRNDLLVKSAPVSHFNTLHPSFRCSTSTWTLLVPTPPNTHRLAGECFFWLFARPVSA